MTDFHLPAILRLIITSQVGWILGVIVGGGLGYLLALGFRSLITSKPNFRRALFLLPWRTGAIALLLLASVPVLYIVIWGFGPKTDIIGIGTITMILMLCTIPSLLLDYWLPNTLRIRFVALMRSIATGSIVIANLFSLLGGSSGSMGQIALFHLRMMEKSMAIGYYMIAVVIVLVIDVLMGVLQYYYFGLTATKGLNSATEN